MTRRSKQRIWVVISIVLMAFLSPAAANVIYVDGNAIGLNNGQDWTNAYRFLKDALAAASSGDEIRVADGIFRPDEDAAHPYGTGDRTAIFLLKNGVAIYGGYQGYIYTPTPPPPMSLSNALGATAQGDDRKAAIQQVIAAATNVSLDESDPNVRDIELYETILSGDLAENDIEVDPCDLLTEPTRAENSYWVSGVVSTNESTVIDGFTITGGNANNLEGGYAFGGGMGTSGDRTTISNCTFTRNSAYSGGGIYNYEGRPTISNCTFNRNSAVTGGGMYNWKSSPMLINCTFTRNSAYSGGGIYNGECSKPTIVNCIFTGNFAGFGGGGICNVSYSRATLTNCTLTRNSAGTNGGAIYWKYNPGPPPFLECTIRWLIITNCIIRGNSDSSGSGESAQIYSGLIPTANYNCIQGLTGALGGTGNIDVDPLFVDTDGADNILDTKDDNLRLLPGSLCIDAGDNTAVPPSVVTDFDGEPRIANGTVDMGAYEGPDQGLLLSAESVTVPEGQTANFTVALAMDPCGTFDVNVSHYSGDTDITVQSGEHLIFDSNNYSQPKTITLAANEDSDSINGQAVFRLSAPGLPPSGVTATEQDNDTILYVDTRAVTGANNGSNWANAFTDLQDALTTASIHTAVNEIRAAQGIYTPADPGGDRMASFELINGVALNGGYAGLGEPDPNERDIELYETILSGDLNGDDGPDFANNVENSIHVVTGSSTEPNAVLDGFTITGGNANGSFPDNCGGGMYNEAGSPTLTNCTFYTNRSSGMGGGMYCKGANPALKVCSFSGNYTDYYGGGMCNSEDSSPILTDCTFTENTAAERGGGIENHTHGNPTLINCRFISNSAGPLGGGMYNLDSNSILNKCTFIDNWARWGGAMLNTGLSNITLTNCTFIGNSAQLIGGGMWNHLDSNITLTNCVLSENSAGSKGGGMICGANSNATLKNCTFSRNSGSYGGNGIQNDSSNELYLSNCILWDNTNAQIEGIAIVSYSNVQGGWLGLGNIYADPCFADANNGDYHLREDSLCINAGDPNYVAAPNEVDLDGKERVSGGRIDMGAYEYQVLTIYVDANAPGPAHDGSSWTNAYKHLQDALADADSAVKPVEIRVAQGIYTPDSNSANPNGTGAREATFQLINGVTLNGGYAGFGEPDPNKRDIEAYETILSGDLAGNDVEVERPHYLHGHPSRVENSYHVVTGSGTDETAIVDGFSITGGKAEGSYPNYVGGGGMYSNSGSPMVTNCTFIRNSSFLFGGGMFNYNSSPNLANCTFNINDGGGMENDESSPRLIQCVFNYNIGSGMYNYNSDITVTKCIFTGNTGVRHGGGIYNDHSIATITNCTFSENKAGGLYNGHNSSLILINCILWDNTPDQINGDIPTVTYSNVQGGWAGLGNIDADPCFVLPGYWDVNGTPGDQRDDFWVNGDHHLKSLAGRWDANSQSWVRDDVTSPCIDSGNPGCPLGDEPNDSNNVRINLGAYGGTAEASNSPANWRSLADMTNDWIVDSNDLKVFVGYWLQMGECIPSDFDRSRSVDFNDFAIFGIEWQQKGPGPGITYEVGQCIPTEFALSAAGESEPTRFTVTVEGSNIHFEDLITANCCADEIELLITLEQELITIYEIEHTPMPPCPCICDYPTTATLGPFEPGTYTFEVYQGEGFIGTTTVTIGPGS